jgi:prepilin-type N-terminal cleavage/methylation domain-containing protein
MSAPRAIRLEPRESRAFRDRSTRREALRPRAPARGEQGFTLIEIIVAVTLTAMMAVALWSVFRIAVTSWARGTADIDLNQRNRSILDLVQKQMGSIYGVLAPINLEIGSPPYPIFWGGRESVHFVSLVSLRFHDNPGLTLVSYEVGQGIGGVQSLVEREERYLGVDPGRDGMFDRSDAVITIFDNLTSFSFEYLDPGAEERPPQWVTSWNPRETGRMPAAISLQMVAREPSGHTWARHMVIPILAAPVDPRLTQANPLERGRPRPREDDPRAR